jgi:hypothetical protein
MRKRLLMASSIALLLLAAGVSRAERVQEEGLRVNFDADFVPHALPRKTPAPISVEVQGSISTTDGSHPPPLRWLELALNRHGRITTQGLSTCSAPLLQSTTSEQALARCKPALVGRGGFHAQLALGTSKDIPAKGRVLAFNSRHAGKPAMLLHLFTGVPVRLTMVVPLTISQRDEGQFGTVVRAHIPKLGGGLGSVTEIHLELGRRYEFHRRRLSYLSAACAAPSGFRDAPFPFIRGSFRFEAHRAIQVTVMKGCSVRS